MHDGSYERNEQEFMRLVVRPGMHVVDVGAHIGFHTVHLADLVSHAGLVTAFEPVSEHATVLLGTIRARRCEGRVRLTQAAVADASGIRTLVIAAPAMAPANAHFKMAAVDVDLTSRQVPVVTLDETLSNRPISFLKIDVEGAEALVLRGARRLLADDHPIVLVDLHPHLMVRLDGTTPAALIHEMAMGGYECRLLGAGVPASILTDLHARGVTTVVFLPEASAQGPELHRAIFRLH